MVNFGDPRVDRLDRNFVPDCDLLNPAANGECLAHQQPAFGTAARSATFDDILLTGFGNREANWEFSARRAARAAAARVAGRRLLPPHLEELPRDRQPGVAASDFDTFSMTVPSDSRLPDGGGYRLDGPAGAQADGVRPPGAEQQHVGPTPTASRSSTGTASTSPSTRGSQNGLTLQVGTSTGRTMEDDCEIVARCPSAERVWRNDSPVISPADPNQLASESFCHRETPWLTQFKAYAVYTVPKVDVQVSGTFRSTGRRAQRHLHRHQRLPGGELDAGPAARGRRREHHHRPARALHRVPRSAQRAGHAIRQGAARRPDPVDPQRGCLQLR